MTACHASLPARRQAGEIAISVIDLCDDRTQEYLVVLS